MEKNGLNKFQDKNVVVLVRYGFKKKTEETQSYEGRVILINDIGIILERRIGDVDDIIVNDFFPWHNIDAIRYRARN